MRRSLFIRIKHARTVSFCSLCLELIITSQSSEIDLFLFSFPCEQCNVVLCLVSFYSIYIFSLSLFVVKPFEKKSKSNSFSRCLNIRLSFYLFPFSPLYLIEIRMWYDCRFDKDSKRNNQQSWVTILCLTMVVLP